MCSRVFARQRLKKAILSGIFFWQFIAQASFCQAQGQLPSSANDADPHAGHRMSEDSPAREGARPQSSPDAGTPAHDHSSMQSEASTPDQHDMAGMDHSANAAGTASDIAGAYLMTLASGTARNPRSWPMPMLMPRLGNWNLMIMGQAFLIDTQQSGPRGGDKFYSSNWAMFAAEHRLGRGSFLFQSMFSLEPATITNRRYPLRFQTGETAYGTLLVDGQHPHDFVMGLGVHYARPIAEQTILHVYYAPVGDPALGPVAFTHRASAFELPQATIAHHLQDATHIASNVATVGLQNKWIGIEASGFNGTEPNENRWNIDWGPMNSYSGRFTVFPSKNWSAQVSAGRLKLPEGPVTGDAHGGDVVRVTASIHYTRPMGGGNAWSTSLIWGRNHNTGTLRNTNSYLLETLFPFSRKNFLTGRIELVDKDELFASNHELEEELARSAGSTFRIQAYTAGYTRDIGSLRSVETGLGFNVSAYVIPEAVKPFYGEHAWGANVFVRLRLKAAR